MSSINHHFVPQFYLRLFASDRQTSKKPKLINLYNLKNNLFIENVSIKKQCYKRKFYGETDELEKHLATIEHGSSILFSLLIKFKSLPPKDSVAYSTLLMFTLLQQLRTKRHADMQNEFIDGMMKAALEGDEQFKDLDEYKIGVKDPVLLSLSILTPKLLAAIDDLEPNLVLLGGNRRFFVSDNPVVAYNQYFEWIKDFSNTGLVSKGLQLFFPLSPQCLLLLYDKEIYHVSGQQNITYDITDNDLHFINALQYINSDENIYFDRMSCRSEIEFIVNKYRGIKKGHKVQTLQFDEGQNHLSSKKSTLITTHVAIPSIHLNLSFLKLKRSAKKVPVRKRSDERYRKEIDFPELDFAPPPDRPQRFIRRKSKDL
jgi:hypothetical protein